MMNRLFSISVPCLLLVLGLLFQADRIQAQTCPFAKSDFDTTNAGVPVITAVGANDSVGPVPYIVIIVPPAHGTLVVIDGRHIEYTPDAGFADSVSTNDLYIYQVCDTTPGGCGCASPTLVNIFVIAPPPPPCTIDALDDSIAVLSGDTIVIDLFANDVDDDSVVISWAVLSGFSNGTYTADSVGHLTYVADSGFIGNDTASYYFCTNCGCDTALIVVSTVDRPCPLPVATNDTFVANYSSACSSTFNVRLNDFPPGGTLTQLSGPNLGIASIDASGVFTYTATTAIAGDVDIITYMICNSCGCDTASVYLHLDNGCEHPPIANWDTIFGNGGPIVIDATDNDSDPDGDSIWVESIIGPPSKGNAILTDSGVLYIPFADEAGIDIITYVLTDETGLHDTAIIIIVTLPKAEDDNAYTMSNEPVVIEVTGNDRISSTTTVSACSEPANGTATFNPDGTVTYTPNEGFEGVDSFCYLICDSLLGCEEAMVYVTITAYDELHVPNAFSPNGDGINDRFVIRGIQAYPLAQLIVFNRWGNEVWRSDDSVAYDNDFEGKNQNGMLLPDGTYYFVLLLNDDSVENISDFVVIRR